MLGILDGRLVQLVNNLAHRSGTLDLVVASVLTVNLIKGGVPVTMLYWAWFRGDQDQVRRRTLAVGTLLGAMIALAIGRLLQVYLPFRPRPLYNPELSLRDTRFLERDIFVDWSSMPSDTAMLFTALTFGIWAISRRLGIVALLHLLLFVVFAKLYTGQHYPSDLLAGAVIGMGVTWLVLRSSFPQRLHRILALWQERAPGLFYGGFFLVTFSIASMFEDLRQLVHVAEFALGGLLRAI
jgi:undecaprenyl-diphosphatase